MKHKLVILFASFLMLTSLGYAQAAARDTPGQRLVAFHQHREGRAVTPGAGGHQLLVGQVGGGDGVGRGRIGGSEGLQPLRQ